MQNKKVMKIDPYKIEIEEITDHNNELVCYLRSSKSRQNARCRKFQEYKH
jgi:hypothetical protein